MPSGISTPYSAAILRIDFSTSSFPSGPFEDAPPEALPDTPEESDTFSLPVSEPELSFFPLQAEIENAAVMITAIRAILLCLHL